MPIAWPRLGAKPRPRPERPAKRSIVPTRTQAEHETAQSDPSRDRERDRNPTGSFRTASTEPDHQGIDSRANRHPGICQERSMRPRTNQANAVVMPQVGHGRPVIVAKAQGRSPSCTCVPKPRGSGTKVFANPNSPANPAAATNNRPRVGQPKRCRTTGCRIMGGPQHEWMVANGPSRSQGPWKGSVL